RGTLRQCLRRLSRSRRRRHPPQPAQLSPEQAWDIAAYVLSQPRPRKAGLDKDFPDLLEKPVDAPYGPYADGFSEQQHKYGPFAADPRRDRAPQGGESGRAIPAAALIILLAAYLRRRASILSQIIAATSGPPRFFTARMPVGEVTLISVR